MFHDADALLLARFQFGFTVSFHFIFPAFSIGLASFLRAGGATARVVTSPEALIAGIADGTLDAGVTEAMLASRLAADNDWTVAWAPPALARYNLVFGLWKGDITLKRVIDQAFADMAGDGTIAAVMARYDVTPID